MGRAGQETVQRTEKRETNTKYTENSQKASEALIDGGVTHKNVICSHEPTRR